MIGYDTDVYVNDRPLALTLCLEEDSILLNKAVLEVLGQPKQVQMLINEEKLMLLLKACTVDDREAIVVPALPIPQFEMSGHTLLKRICRLTGWADNRPRVVFGNYLAPYRVVVFDLRTALFAELQLPLDVRSGGLY